MAQSNKPRLSATFTDKVGLSLGPFYGMREGTGTLTRDDSPSHAPCATLRGGASWLNRANGPLVRLSSDGDFLSIPDDPALRRPSTAVTLILSVTPAGFAPVGSFAGYAGKRSGYNGLSFGLFSDPSLNPGDTLGQIALGDGVYLNSAFGCALTAGRSYVLVLRWRSGLGVEIRSYDRATGALIDGAVGPPGTGSLYYDGKPFEVGRVSNPDTTAYVKGDYEFVAVSDQYLTDAQLLGFVANPWAGYQAIDADYALSGPTGGLPGTTSQAFSVTLNVGVNPARALTVTPKVVGFSGTFEPPSVSLSTASRVATFRLRPAMSARGLGTVSATNSGALHDPPGVLYSAQYGPPPHLAEYEALMSWCATGKPAAYPVSDAYFADGDDHYDPIRIFEQVRAYTGQASWDDQIAAAVRHYRDMGVLASGGHSTGYHTYTSGLRRHYDRTGDTLSRDAAVLLSLYAAFSSDVSPPLASAPQTVSREVAFSILSKLDAEALGCAHRPFLETQVGYALGHIQQWTAPEGSRSFSTLVQPFMVALTCEALIAYWDRYRAAPDRGPGSPGHLCARIPAAVKSAIDYLWEETWHPAGSEDHAWPYGAFQYTDINTPAVRSPVPSTVAGGTEPSALAFRGGTSLSSQDDYYKYAAVEFTGGALQGQILQVSGYTGATRTFHFKGSGYQYTGDPAAGDPFAVCYNPYAPVGTNLGDPADSQTKLAPALNLLIAPIYAWYYAYTVAIGARDNTYRRRHDDIFDGSLIRLGYVDTQKEYNQHFRLSIQGLRWRSQGDAPWPAATALTLVGPSATGRVNALSDRFSASLVGENVSTPAPVVVTPTDGGAGGTFLPATVTLTTDNPTATFRYRPASAGPVTISLSNNGGLTNPPSLVYATAGVAPLATGYKLTPPTLVNGPGEYSGDVGLSVVPPGAVPGPAADRTGAVVSVNLSLSVGTAATSCAGVLPLSQETGTQTFQINTYGNEVQQIAANPAPTGGTFTLSFGGATTAAIPWNATAGQVQSALTALPSIGLGNALVRWGPLPARLLAEFSGTLGSTPQRLLSVDNSGLSGGAYLVSERQPGHPGGVTVTLGNDGGLTDPPPFTYTPLPIDKGTDLVLAGPTAGVVGTGYPVVLSATQELGPYGMVSVTFTDPTGGGTFSPATANLFGNRRSVSTVFTPRTPGVQTLAVTNTAGLTNPSPLPFAASAGVKATSGYTLNFPIPAGGVSGGNGAAFTVAIEAAEGPGAPPVTVTPGDGGAGGTFHPPSLTLTASAPTAVFHYVAPNR